jgi:hypothetical protein
VDRKKRRVSFVRSSANVASRVLGRKGGAEADLCNKRNTGIKLYLQRHIAVSSECKGRADIGKISEERRTKYLFNRKVRR